MLSRVLAILILSFGVLSMPAGLPVPAEAVTININVGTNLNNGRRITCSEGERHLRNRGFRDIRRIDCRGRYFTYRGSRFGNRYEISIRSSNGRVVDLRRIRW